VHLACRSCLRFSDLIIFSSFAISPIFGKGWSYLTASFALFMMRVIDWAGAIFLSRRMIFLLRLVFYPVWLKGLCSYSPLGGWLTSVTRWRLIYFFLSSFALLKLLIASNEANKHFPMICVRLISRIWFLILSF
jgi:hypothetical protein